MIKFRLFGYICYGECILLSIHFLQLIQQGFAVSGVYPRPNTEKQTIIHTYSKFRATH